MHCTLVIKQNERNSKTIKKILKEYNFAEPLDGYYIIEIYDKRDWQEILENLNEHLVKTNYILTPILDTGFYNGRLENIYWDKINEITNRRY